MVRVMQDCVRGETIHDGTISVAPRSDGLRKPRASIAGRSNCSAAICATATISTGLSRLDHDEIDKAVEFR